MGDYEKRNVRELKALLMHRRLRVGGIKSTLIARLIACDDADEEARRRQEPFRFFDLPSEIRNMIYTMITCSEARHWSGFTSRRNIRFSQKSNHLEITQPDLFRTCRQARAEGLSIFYRARSFGFRLHASKIALDGVVAWLDVIGDVYRLAIPRVTLELPYEGKISAVRSYAIIARILIRLPETAPLIFRGLDVHTAIQLWALGTYFKTLDLFDIPLVYAVNGQPYDLGPQIFPSLGLADHYDTLLKFGPGRLSLKNLAR
ncbi:MAG: hypothetical protein Q9163_001989 [Psora crenata]